jgi:hypothetical protein
MDYKKKYLKYKDKYRKSRSKLSLMNIITSELNLEKDVKLVSTIDNIKFMLNIDKVVEIIKNYPQNFATPLEKYMINLNLNENAFIMHTISQNHQHNLLLDIYFTIGNEYSLESIHFNKIYENLNLLDEIETSMITRLDKMMADNTLNGFYNIDVIIKWKHTIVNKPVEKLNYFKVSKLSNEEKEKVWAKYLIVWDKFNKSCMKVKEHLDKVEKIYQNKHKNEIIGCYNISKDLYDYCLESHMGVKLDVIKLEKWALKELDNLVANMKNYLKEIDPNVDLKISHIELIKKMAPAQLYKSKEEFIDHHQKVVDKYKKKFIDELGFKLYENLNLVIFDNKDLAAGYYFDNKFYLNSFSWKDSYKYLTESLILHEAFPGHHLQVHTSKYNDMKDGLLYSYFDAISNGFCEGWGLFSENLGYEQTVWDKIGHIEFDILRTLRVIVDIRIHCKGATPKEIYHYMKQYSSLPDGEIMSEVYRYACYPGQAVCYKIGNEMFKIIVKKMNKDNDFLTKEKINLYKEIIEAGPMPLCFLLDKYKIKKDDLFN